MIIDIVLPLISIKVTTVFINFIKLTTRVLLLNWCYKTQILKNDHLKTRNSQGCISIVNMPLKFSSLDPIVVVWKCIVVIWKFSKPEDLESLSLWSFCLWGLSLENFCLTIFPSLSRWVLSSMKPFLRLIEEYIVSLDPPRPASTPTPQSRTHRGRAYRALAHGP